MMNLSKRTQIAAMAVLMSLLHVTAHAAKGGNGGGGNNGGGKEDEGPADIVLMATAFGVQEFL